MISLSLGSRSLSSIPSARIGLVNRLRRPVEDSILELTYAASIRYVVPSIRHVEDIGMTLLHVTETPHLEAALRCG